jgi:hypothetical protein
MSRMTPDDWAAVHALLSRPDPEQDEDVRGYDPELHSQDTGASIIAWAFLAGAVVVCGLWLFGLLDMVLAYAR